MEHAGVKISSAPIYPFLASWNWWRRYAYGLRTGMDKADAVTEANRCCMGSRRELARCTICSHHTPLVLTVPVEGGASIWKRSNPGIVMISQHGNWQHMHLGAFEAVYGRAPYFEHLFPELKRVYDTFSHGELSRFTRALVSEIETFMNFDENLDVLKRLEKEDSERYFELCNVYNKKINPDLSVTDALMRLGPAAILAMYDLQCTL